MESSRSLMYFLGFVVCVSAFPYFQDRIPNGNKVPDPCFYWRKQKYIYPQVGHHKQSPDPRNSFGEDFEKVQHNWTALCELDSDGDGWKNGYELGDTHCMWDPDNNETDIYLEQPRSHPGIEEVFSQEYNRLVPTLKTEFMSCSYFVPQWI